jgi:hypothetical protein
VLGLGVGMNTNDRNRRMTDISSQKVDCKIIAIIWVLSEVDSCPYLLRYGGVGVVGRPTRLVWSGSGLKSTLERPK